MFERFDVIRNAPMREYTTLKLGGPADYLAFPKSAEEIAVLFAEAGDRGMPVTVIGHGSNLLVLDGGIRGLVIRMGRGMNDCGVDGHTLRASGSKARRWWSRRACCWARQPGRRREPG